MMEQTDKPIIAELIADHVPVASRPAARAFAGTWSAERHARPLLQILLLGLGAAITIPLMGYLVFRSMEMLSLDAGTYQIAVGVALLAGSVFLQRHPRRSRNVGEILYILLITGTFATGAGLLIYGLVNLTGKAFVIPVTAMLVTAATGYLVGRGIGYAICLYLTLVCIPLFIPGDAGHAARSGAPLFGATCFGSIMLLIVGGTLKPRQIVGEAPVLRALAAAIVTLLAIRVMFSFVLPPETAPVKLMSLPGVSTFLAIAGLCLLAHLGGGWRSLGYGPLLLSALATIALAALNAPGILLGLFLLVLGYHRADRFLTGLGAVQIPLYLYIFYYNLEADLLTKSGLLVLGGVILLTGYGWLQLRGRDDVSGETGA